MARGKRLPLLSQKNQSEPHEPPMKKIFTLSLAIALCGAANAEKVNILTLGLGIPGIDEPQLMGLSISPDGQYVCGSIEYGEGIFSGNVFTNEFTYLPTDDLEGAELRDIDNNGLAIGYDGPGITYSIDGVEKEIPTPEGYRYVLGEGLSNDGSVMIGSLMSKGYDAYGAYSVNGGEWTLLPLPDDELLGDCADSGSMAKYVSGDGKVILGHIGNFGPAILWVMNEDGEYEADPLFSKYVIMTEEDYDSEKELLGLFSMGLSNNGKYAVFKGTIETEDGMMSVPAVYDIENQTMSVYKEPQDIDQYGVGLFPSAVANDGTFIGIIGMPIYGSYGSFIWKAGEQQAQTFCEAFPAFAEKFMIADMYGLNIPTSMSADGRYILGYSYYADDFFSEDEEEPAYYVTYVIDTKDVSTSINEIDAEVLQEAVPTAYYNLQGQRVSNMTKGVNIIRMSDGSVRKVINK